MRLHRRHASHSLAAAGSVGLAARLPDEVWAKRKKKLKRNVYDRVDGDGKCRGKSANCCSGICDGDKPKKGKKDKSRCVAHDAEGCQAGGDPCNNVNEIRTTSLGNPVLCNTTTGMAGYCGYDGGCLACGRDADCREIFGPHAACVLCSDCAQGTSCSAPKRGGPHRRVPT